RILAQHRLDLALSLDYTLPIHLGDGAQTHDAVGHHDLRQSEVLRGSRARHFGGDRAIVDPLLDLGDRLVRPATQSELVQETGDEYGRQSWWCAHQRVERL